MLSVVPRGRADARARRLAAGGRCHDAVDRIPPAGAPVPSRPFAFPEIRRRRSPNGLDVWTAEHRDVPLCRVLVLVPAGAADDPADRPGLAAITGDLLDEGCGDLDALGAARALGRLGAQLDTEVGSDADADRPDDARALRGRRRWRCWPTCSSGRASTRRDFDRVRELRLNRLLQLRDMPPAVAERVFTQRLYGAHPYGHLPIGSEASLRAMSVWRAASVPLADVRSRAGSTVIAVGDGSHDDLADAVEAAFGELARRSPPTWSSPIRRCSRSLQVRLRLTIIQRDARAAVGAAHRSRRRVAQSTPDYHALVALNMVLGGQFVSRINTNLRERKGYTYGARTSFDFRRGRARSCCRPACSRMPPPMPCAKRSSSSARFAANGR